MARRDPQSGDFRWTDTTVKPQLRGSWYIRIEGLTQIQESSMKVVREVSGGPEFLRAMHRATHLVWRDATKAVPINTGRLKGSLKTEVRREPVEKRIWGIVGANTDYAAAVEFGSGPHWAPLRPLVRWVQLKHLASSPPEVLRIARAVRYRIATYGTDAHAYLVPAFQKNEGKIVDMLDAALGKTLLP